MDIARLGTHELAVCPWCDVLFDVPGLPPGDAIENLQQLARDHRAESPACQAAFDAIPSMSDLQREFGPGMRKAERERQEVMDMRARLTILKGCEIKTLACKWLRWRHGNVYALKPPLGWSPYARPALRRRAWYALARMVYRFESAMFARWGQPLRDRWLLDREVRNETA